MQSIKEKIASDNKALEKWCNNFYKEVWNAQETQGFKDAKVYCVEQ
ncbi:hypothetical protein [Candidatus Mycoplasma haematobovis]|nr:hypothetical protein [Candidatus Mycoplasma haematobovis]